MAIQDTNVDMMEYRLVLVLSESREILALPDGNGHRLPSISIPQWARQAEQLREAIHTTWKVCVFFLDFIHGSPTCAVGEVLDSAPSSSLKAVSLKTLRDHELAEEQRSWIASTLVGDSPVVGPLSRIGWIHEAIAWLESETERKLSSKREIQQYNAGSGFTLVRFRMQDGRDYWLKATGEPNIHERSITTLLSKLCGTYLPKVISSKPEWNAWLMSGEATCVKEIPSDPFQRLSLLKEVVACMAKLQIKTRGHDLDLLDAGAFDQRSQVFKKNAAKLFDYLEEAMSLQTSTKAPRLEKNRLLKLRAVFEEVCQRVEDLAISETIVHGDMNYGNILSDGGHCQFIDWSEAYLGNPLITLAHLLLLNKQGNSAIRNFIDSELKQRYLNIWTASCDPNAFQEGFVYMPFLAVASTLYGRGSWLDTPKRNDPRRQSYARTLARNLDRAAREPALLEAICH